MSWVPSVGILRFDSSVPKVYVEVDQDVVELARAILPQSLKSKIRKQKYPAHISVIRNEPIDPHFDQPYFKRVDGFEIPFEYDPEPVIGSLYAWLRVLCPVLETMRWMANLPPSSEWTRPPDGENVFHITIGNFKA